MELVRDPVIEVEAAVVQHVPHAAEERGIVGDAHVLDHADRGDLVVARARRNVAEVAVLDEAAPGKPLPRDPLRRPVRLRPGQGHAVGAHPIVLRGPDGQGAPAAADVEERLTGLQAQLAADEVELVRLRLLELAVGIAIVRAGVDHERVEEECIEVVRHVVVVGDRLRVVLLAPPPLHARASFAAGSFIPKMESNTTRRRARSEPSTRRTASRASASGSRLSCRPAQVGSPAP